MIALSVIFDRRVRRMYCGRYAFSDCGCADDAIKIVSTQLFVGSVVQGKLEKSNLHNFYENRGV